MPLWETKKVLITVRTYPSPAQKGVEVSCTAGITEDREWIRLFPVPYRFLAGAQRFKKYQWIKLNVQRARDDPRPESYKLDRDSIQIVSEPLPSASKWRARKEIVFPLKSRSLCALRAARKKQGYPTLGIFQPAEIKRLLIEPDNAEWSPSQLARLRQLSLFNEAPRTELEKIPFRFRYEFRCAEATCTGHTMVCTDWEIGQSYRNFRRVYGPNGWEAKFREKFESGMQERCDTHFYVGTLHTHPNIWIIVGLFYPLK